MISGLVEEYMLLANMLVAQQILLFLKVRHCYIRLCYLPNVLLFAMQECALLRHHPPPQARQMSKVIELCKQLGLDIDTSSAATLHRSLNAFETSAAQWRQNTKSSSRNASSNNDKNATLNTQAPGGPSINSATESKDVKDVKDVKSTTSNTSTSNNKQDEKHPLDCAAVAVREALMRNNFDLRSTMEHLCTKPMQQAKYFCTGGLFTECKLNVLMTFWDRFRESQGVASLRACIRHVHT